MSTETIEKRQKVVMALGIATIILFSANLLAVLAKHFWPDKGLPFMTEQEVTVEAPSHYEYEVYVRHERPHEHRKHRIVVRTPSAVSHFVVDELDRDIADMEKAAVRLERELTMELESVMQLEGIMELESIPELETVLQLKSAMRELEIDLQDVTDRAQRRSNSSPSSDT
jgi:hypothetical protein